MNEQHNILFQWAEENRNTFEPLYRKDARRHYNETPFSADLLADFVIEVQSLLKRAGYGTVPTALVDKANHRLAEEGWYFRFSWIDENTGNYLTDSYAMTPQQRNIAQLIVDELRGQVA